MRVRLRGVMVGPDLVEHERGWRVPDLGRDDECMRASFCTVAGVHPIKIPWIAPGEPNFWRDYEKLANILGYRWEERFGVNEPKESVRRGPWPFADHELWLAGVGNVGGLAGGNGTPHAIVMRGQKLHYDCLWDHGSGRKRRPTRIGWGIAMVPADG